MLDSLTRRVIAAPRLVLSLAVVLLIAAGLYGAGAASKMLPGGYEDPGAESTHATSVLDDVFGQGGPQVVFKLDGPAGTDMATDPAARAVGQQILDRLETTSWVQKPVLSIWSSPELAGELLSRDKSSTQIIAGLDGGDAKAPGRAEELSKEFSGTRDGITIKVGGAAMVYGTVNEQTSKDLAIAEAIAIPISFLLLIVIFGGVVAAALPVLVGIVAIVGTMALLRVITEFADVSIYALNLTTAMGLALAIDYTLLIVTRYREEVAAGRPRDEAIVRTINTAGRTVIFSAVTVGLSLAALAIFPMYFLRSFAYAGIGVVVVAVVAAIVITPALLAVLGGRVDALDLRRGVRKLLRRPAPEPKPLEEGFWYRSAQWVLRRAVPVALAVTAFLVVLGLPFAGIKFGFPDDRVLPASSPPHAIAQEIRDQYDESAASNVTAVVHGKLDEGRMAHYAGELSKVRDVTSVSSPAGVFRDGRRLAPAPPGLVRGDDSLIQITGDVEPMRPSGQKQITALRAVERPAGVQVSFTGLAAVNADTVSAIYASLPWVLVVIAVATYLLLFLFTGSVVLPLKALVMNVLSLSATFGAMVWIFQDGHLGGLGTTPMGYLVATMPVLMFCIAFGLSMDYEVFLLGRIREEWLKSDRTRAANDHAVAIGLARTGRVVTAAALLMAIVFAGIAASQVSFMRMFGVGLALAVLMDATLIRMMLVPAFMRLAGRWNWWAPAPLRRLHDRIGLVDE
ncbi:MMPL family transporter [Gordonia sp. PP30]|uniref:MMPL family transporter n=1 Tax=Gordonia sp. PP30 TaxID=2935861 RepID=UPI001FFF8259|nr:MMPL family transporter [Gordonia sp. PP30]UQE76029.1 MMPL family transporter [Gordonia sp. PP30]